jgi:hypothetical protein
MHVAEKMIRCEKRLGEYPTLSAILVWLRRRSRAYVLVSVRKEEARRSRLPVTVATQSRS